MKTLDRILTPVLSVLLFLTFMFRMPLAAIGIVLVLGMYVFIYTADAE